MIVFAVKNQICK